MAGLAFPDFSVTTEGAIAEGDKVALRLIQRGTLQDEFTGIEPTGREFEIQATSFFHMADGQIVE